MVMGVFVSTPAVPKDDQSWLVNRISDGVSTVTLDLSTFLGDNEDQYFAALNDEDTVGYLKSGIPLARIDGTQHYGPYDPAATDGRQNAVAGFLESQYEVEFTRKGLKGGTDQEAGMRYMAVINKDNLPVVPADGTVYKGLVLNFDKENTQQVTLLSGTGAASTGAFTPAAPVDKPAADADAAALSTSIGALIDALTAAGLMAGKGKKVKSVKINAA